MALKELGTSSFDKPADEIEEIDSEAVLTTDPPVGAGKAILSAGTEIAGSVAGEIALRKIKPLKKIAKGVRFGAGALSSIVAQKGIEKKQDISLGRIIGAGTANTLFANPAATAYRGLLPSATRPVARAAAQGAIIGATDRIIAEAIDDGKLSLKNVAIAAGTGGLLGSGIGKAAVRFGDQTAAKLVGKTDKQIDTMIARDELTLDEVKGMLEPVLGPGVTQKEIQKTKQRLLREHMARNLADVEKPLSKVWTEFKNNFIPEQQLGKNSREDYYDFVVNLERGAALSSRMNKLLDELILSGRDDLARDAQEYLAGMPMSDALSREGIAGDLRVMRDVEIETMKEMHAIIRDSEELRFLPKEAQDIVLERMQQAISKGVRTYDSSAYRAFFDQKWTTEKSKFSEEEVLEEIQDTLIRSEGLEPDEALKKAVSHVKHLKSMFAKEGQSRNILGSLPGRLEVKIDNHAPGPKERDFLGEITDTTQIGTIAKFKYSDPIEHLSKIKSDQAVVSSLGEAGLISTVKKPGYKELILQTTSGKNKAGEQMYVPLDTDDALQKLYAVNVEGELKEGIAKQIRDLYGTAIGLSKSTKVILNPPSYMVNILSSNVLAASNGVIPNYFKSSTYKGANLALTELHNGYRWGAKAFGKGDKVNDPALREKLLQDINEMYKYGLGNATVAAQEVSDAINNGKLGRGVGKLIEPAGKLYSVPDTAMRYVVWDANQDMLKKVFLDKGVKMADDDVKRIAASITNDTFQNYARTSRQAKYLSKIGLLPPFITFSLEMTRNLTNQLRLLNKMIFRPKAFADQFGIQGMNDAAIDALRAEGLRRSAYLGAVLGITAGAGTMASQVTGKLGPGEKPVTSEQMDDFKFATPEYARNKDLMATYNPETKKGTFANTSYIMPHSMFTQALKLFTQAPMNLMQEEQAVESIFSFMKEEFMGEGNFINQNLMRAIDNRDLRGKTITNREGLQAMLDKVWFFGRETFKPGIIREYERFNKAVNGKGDYTVEEVLARQLGLRFTKMDANEMYKFRVQDFSKRYSEARGSYTTDLKYRSDQMTKQQLEQSYRSAVQEASQAYARIEEAYERMDGLGFSVDEKIEVLRGGNVRSSDIFRIVNGLEFEPFPSEVSLSVGERFSEMSEGKDRKQIREEIRKLKRGSDTDKLLATRFESEYQRRINDEKRGRTPQDKILMNMSIIERVNALKALNAHRDRRLFKEYKRKGVITKDVAMLLKRS